MALTILSLMPNAPSYDVKILATDIDPNMVAEGSKGVYADNIVSAVPAELRSRWFVNLRDERRMWSVGEEMRQLVAFRELNLIGNWPMKGKFQAIFCRNVVIYFEEETQSEIWRRFVPMLTARGRLYIGHSERLSGPAASAFETEGITIYRLREGSARR